MPGWKRNLAKSTRMVAGSGDYRRTGAGTRGCGKGCCGLVPYILLPRCDMSTYPLGQFLRRESGAGQLHEVAGQLCGGGVSNDCRPFHRHFAPPEFPARASHFRWACIRCGHLASCSSVVPVWGYAPIRSLSPEISPFRRSLPRSETNALAGGPFLPCNFNSLISLSMVSSVQPQEKFASPSPRWVGTNPASIALRSSARSRR